MKKTITVICSVFFCLAMMLLILTFSIGLPIYIRPFYYAQIEPLGLPEKTEYTAEEIREAFDEVMDYLTLPNREFGTGVFKHSAEGQAHFEDCRFLFSLNFWCFILSAAFILFAYIAHRKRWIKLPSVGGFGLPLVAGSSLFAICVTLVACVASDFSKAFTVFHKIFFHGKDNWQFYPDVDEIIRVLPSEFFLNCAVLIGASLLVCSVSLILFSVLRKRKIRK